MFSLLVGYSSWRQLFVGLLLTAVGIAFCFARDADPGFLGFRLGRQLSYLLMLLLGFAIGWPVRMLGRRKWIALALALIFGSVAFVMLIMRHDLVGTIFCLLAQMEWVGSSTKTVSFRQLFEFRQKR